MALQRIFDGIPGKELEPVFKEKTGHAPYQLSAVTYRYVTENYGGEINKLLPKIAAEVKASVSKVPNSQWSFESNPSMPRIEFGPNGFYVHVCEITCDSSDVYERRKPEAIKLWKDVQKAASYESVASKYKSALAAIHKDASFRILYWTKDGWIDNSTKKITRLSLCIYIPDGGYIDKVADQYNGRDKDKDPGAHSKMDPSSEARMLKLGRQFIDMYKKYAQANMTKAMRSCIEWGGTKFGQTWRGKPNDLLLFEIDIWGYDNGEGDHELPASFDSIKDDDEYADAISKYIDEKLAIKPYVTKFNQMAKKVDSKFSVHYESDEQCQVWIACD